jgi:hypothetical protein
MTDLAHGDLGVREVMEYKAYELKLDGTPLKNHS